MLEIQKFSKIIAANWKMHGSIKFIDNFVDQLNWKNGFFRKDIGFKIIDK